MEKGWKVKERGRVEQQRDLRLGLNAFIYIQKSQVKYTYVLLTIDARVNGRTRASFSFLA